MALVAELHYRSGCGHAPAGSLDRQGGRMVDRSQSKTISRNGSRTRPVQRLGATTANMAFQDGSRIREEVLGVDEDLANFRSFGGPRVSGYHHSHDLGQ